MRYAARSIQGPFGADCADALLMRPLMPGADRRGRSSRRPAARHSGCAAARGARGRLRAFASMLRPCSTRPGRPLPAGAARCRVPSARPEIAQKEKTRCPARPHRDRRPSGVFFPPAPCRQQQGRRGPMGKEPSVSEAIPTGVGGPDPIYKKCGGRHLGSRCRTVCAPWREPGRGAEPARRGAGWRLRGRLPQGSPRRRRFAARRASGGSCRAPSVPRTRRTADRGATEAKYV